MALSSAWVEKSLGCKILVFRFPKHLKVLLYCRPALPLMRQLSFLLLLLVKYTPLAAFRVFFFTSVKAPGL